MQLQIAFDVPDQLSVIHPPEILLATYASIAPVPEPPVLLPAGARVLPGVDLCLSVLLLPQLQNRFRQVAD